MTFCSRVLRERSVSAFTKAKRAMKRLFGCCLGATQQNDEAMQQDDEHKPTDVPAGLVAQEKPQANDDATPIKLTKTPVPLVPYSDTEAGSPLPLALMSFEAMANSPPFGITPGTTELVPYVATPGAELTNAMVDSALIPAELSPGLQGVLDYYLGEEGEEGADEPLDVEAWEQWRSWEEWQTIRQLREDSSSDEDEEEDEE